MDYFYLGSSLPKLGTQDLTAEKDIENIQNHIYSQLEDEDRAQFVYLLYKNDNKNLLHILRKKEGIIEDPLFTFHKPAIFTYQELEEGISGSTPLPGYMRFFLKKFSSGYEGRKAENELVNLYFKEAIDVCGNFLSDYFQFKRNLKNIISGINSRLFGYPVGECLVGSGLVVDTILKSNTNDLGLSKYYSFIEDLTHIIESADLVGLEKRVDSIIIQYLNSHTPLSPFSEDAIFLYFIKLMIGNRWIPLEEEQGKQELIRSLNWVVNSAHLPRDIAMESSK